MLSSHLALPRELHLLQVFHIFASLLKYQYSGLVFNSSDTAAQESNCEFKNCRFKDVILRKCEFWNTTFENCQIERSNLTKANFHKGTFRNCIFIKANLTASNFSEFEFIKTKFNNSDLDLIGARSIKVWKLNQCIEIEESSNFGDLLENRSSDG